jgi:hypothetical protein
MLSLVSVCCLSLPIDFSVALGATPADASHSSTTAQATAASTSTQARAKRSRVKKRRRHANVDRRPARTLVQLAEGPGYTVSDPHKAWGTSTTVANLQKVFASYHEAYPEAQSLYVHDLSRQRGGRLAPHSSHRSGRDVDIRVIQDPPTDKYRNATAKTIDLERTWFLLSALIQTHEVEYIFLDARLQRVLYRYAQDQGVSEAELDTIFQYPRRARAQSGIIRHEPGHRDHFHVRFLREKLPIELVL